MISDSDYEKQRDEVAAAVLKIWCPEIYDDDIFDPDEEYQLTRSVNDAVNDVWVEGLSVEEWTALTVKFLTTGAL